MYEDFERPQNIGHLFGALPIAAFEDLDVYYRRMAKAAADVRGVAPRPGRRARLPARRARGAARRGAAPRRRAGAARGAGRARRRGAAARDRAAPGDLTGARHPHAFAPAAGQTARARATSTPLSFSRRRSPWPCVSVRWRRAPSRSPAPSLHAAQDVKLPPTLTLTAYDTGSSGFNIAVAIGKAFKDKHGTDVRVLPAGNDVARLAPLKGGRAQASAMGIGVYFAQEGVFEFGGEGLGPAAAAPHARLERLQRDLARRREGHRRQGDQGPEGQARRHGRRRARAQPERLRGARLRQSHAQRREARRVLELRRDVEGHPQQRGGRGDRLDHLGPGEGSRGFAARPRTIRRHRPPTRRAGTRLHKFGPYYAPHKATCGIGITQGQVRSSCPTIRIRS